MLGSESGAATVMQRGSLLTTLASAVVLALGGCGTQEAGQLGGSQGDGGVSAERDDRVDELNESVLTFTATTVGGEAFRAVDLEGRPAVFWFWAPWCPTCVADAPHVLDLAREHGDTLSVVGVAGLGSRAEMADFIALTGTEEFTHLDDEAGAVWRHFGVTAQSTYAVVDSSGRVVDGGYLEPAELAELVDTLVD